MACLESRDDGLALYAIFQSHNQFQYGTVALYILSSSASQVANSQEISDYFNNLLAVSYSGFRNFIISQTSKCTVHIYHFLGPVRNQLE